jgi:hypothetical protein
MNGGIINSVTRLHLVDYFYCVISIIRVKTSVLFLLNMSSTDLIHAIFMDVYLRHTVHIAVPNKDQSFGQEFIPLNAELNPICYLLAY